MYPLRWGSNASIIMLCDTVPRSVVLLIDNSHGGSVGRLIGMSFDSLLSFSRFIGRK